VRKHYSQEYRQRRPTVSSIESFRFPRGDRIPP